ncbi:MAG: non-canonical purine NTP pyrophosphatase [SAR324 cluster bacterium]|nr:non-canonical purine NTP pyrophosphatase [SAR324 cluster bacterium]
MRINSIVLITGNAGKLGEFKELINLEALRFGYKSLYLPEIQSLDILKIGRYKTKIALSSQSEMESFDAVLTDDTALYCKALNGLPGPLIKWFLDRLKPDGLVKLIKGKDKRASVTCLLSLGMIKTGKIIQFAGTIEGKLVHPQGRNGFGWDPVFMPDGSELTYGEMAVDKKNKISHRAIAVKKFRDWLIAE